jgi:tungstate transport system substrate-binding protein
MTDDLPQGQMVGAMKRNGLTGAVTFLLACLTFFASGNSAARDLMLATTTSTDNSGLLRYLLPMFEAEYGTHVRVISVGTGKAIRLGENGDVDVILVHSRPDEDRFVAEGYGVNRRDVMYNDFVIVGPPDDPAGIRGMHDVVQAFDAIARTTAIFVSRGDDSGTHKMEMRYWAQLATSPQQIPGYRAAGRGMGEVLLMASELQGYTLTDRATYLAMQDKIDLQLLVDGDQRMFNPYGVIAVNPARYPDINFEGATDFIEWITSPAGQQSIGEFRIGGKQVFFPDAK